MTERVSPLASAVGQFKPKPRNTSRPTAEQIDNTSTFPARDPAPTQPPSSSEAMTAIGVRYHPHVIERFKRMCRADRRSYGQMLERLMNAYEGIPNPD